MLVLFPDAERRDLGEVIEHGPNGPPTPIASQLSVTDWHAVIGGPNQTDAICDRLLHDARRIELKGRSMRRTHQAPKTRTPGRHEHRAGDTGVPSRPVNADRCVDRDGAWRNACELTNF